MNHLRVDCTRPDERPAVWLRDVDRARVSIARARGVTARHLVMAEI